MFKGSGLFALVGTLVLVSTFILLLEWHAIGDLRSTGDGADGGRFRKGALRPDFNRGAEAVRASAQAARNRLASLTRRAAEVVKGTSSRASVHANVSKTVAGIGGSGVSNTEASSRLLRGGGSKALPLVQAEAEQSPTTQTLAPVVLPSFPTPPEMRHRDCVRAKYDVSSMPSVAIIIPYLNESWLHISASLAALLAHSTPELLDEILMIDDGNPPEHQHHDEMRAIHPKVRVHRNEQRQGLIRAKVIGAGLVSSPIIVFSEPHCIVLQHWLEPMLVQLMAATDHNTVVMPLIDIIPENDFNAYRVANHHIGGFDWSLTFNWMELIEHRNRSYQYPEPYPTPALSGGIFGIWRDYWDRTGAYDTNMTEWGGEHIEMSLRTWRCGGQIKVVPCSRMGHVFRAKNPYIVHPIEVVRNMKRVALVWLEEYIDKFYNKVSAARHLDAGVVTERVALKEKLQCKNMTWFVENVYPELMSTQPRHR